MRAIRVWRFHKSPKRYQEMSKHGGDEDWVAFIPYEFGGDDPYIPWLDEERFGCAGVSKHRDDIMNGWVFIGAHA